MPFQPSTALSVPDLSDISVNGNSVSPNVKLKSPSSPKDRIIRVFISSTFRDMMEERDILIKKIFPQLRKLCEERAVTWIEVDLRWGITDEQKAEGKVLPLCLEEIQRCRPYFIGLLGERYGWVPEPNSIPADLLHSQAWLKQHLQHSVTELEILHGVFSDESMHGYAYFYFRDPKYLESISPEKRACFTSEGTDSAGKLGKLKDKIRNARDLQVCELRENYVTPEQLGAWILEDFSKLIDRLYPKDQTPGPLDQEAARHEAYARGRRLAFVGRDDLLLRLTEHCRIPGKPIVLTGESGCGKSALLAEWVARWRNDHPDDLIIQHYIGSTPDSADWQGLVRRILGEFKRAFEIPDDIPIQSDALCCALNDWTRRVSSSRSIILVIDALNQLDDDGAARQLAWLPAVFPANFRVLVSLLPGKSLDVLRKREWLELNVPLFTQADIAPASLAYFKMYSKTPPPDIVESLESTPAARNALYLRAVLDELRQFGKHEELKAKAVDYLSASSPVQLYERILKRWQQDFGEEPVRQSLSLIWASRRGLSEVEILDLLGKQAKPREPFPRAKWTPFYLAAENAIAQQSGLLNFSHEFIRCAVEAMFLSSEANRRAIHKRLANYFLDSSNSNRGAPELIWHFVRASMFELFQAIVTEPHCFVTYWENDPRLLMECWTLVERGSPLTVVEAYRQLLEHTPADVDTVIPVCALLISRGHYAECAVPLLARVNQLRAEGNRFGLIDALRLLGTVCKDQNDQAQLAAIIREQGELETELGKRQPLFARLGNLAYIAESEKKLASALELHKQVERVARENGDRANLHVALSNQSRILLQQRREDEALDLARQAVLMAREMNDDDALAYNLGVEGDVLLCKQELKSALKCYGESEVIYRRIGNSRMLAYTLFNKARILYLERLAFLALPCAIEARALFKDSHRQQDAETAHRLLEDIRLMMNGPKC